jgi:CRISPR-associated protein (TIGR02710 family)
LAVEERRRLVLAFNGYQFDAATQVLQGLLDREGLDSPRRRWFEALQVACEGYRAWDRFQYPEALDRLRRAQKVLATQADLAPGSPATPLVPQVAAHVSFLESLRAEPDAFRRPCATMVVDLLGNADRRAAEGKHDDAVARLYRATEMVAQVAFLRPPLACLTDAVPPDRVPAALREEYRGRYFEPKTGTLKLPLYAAFRALQEVGAAEGQAFFAREEDFNNLLAARNGSVLAHGFSAIQRETFERFRALVGQCFGVGEPPAFPRLDGA